MKCYSKNSSEMVKAVVREGHRSATLILSVINRTKTLL